MLGEPAGESRIGARKMLCSRQTLAKVGAVAVPTRKKELLYYGTS